MLAFNNCSGIHDPETSNLSSTIDTTSARALAAQSVLAQNCASCHGNSTGQGGLGNVTDLSHLVSGGFIIPGNPAASPLIQEVISGSMPPTGALQAAQTAALTDWVSEAGSSPGSNPGNLPATTTPTFASISANILVPKCVSCHGSSVQNGGYRFDSYAGTMAAVHAGDLAGSPLYTQIASGAMPNGGPILDTSLIETIDQWILGGAPNN